MKNQTKRKGESWDAQIINHLNSSAVTGVTTKRAFPAARDGIVHPGIIVSGNFDTGKLVPLFGSESFGRGLRSPHMHQHAETSHVSSHLEAGHE